MISKPYPRKGTETNGITEHKNRTSQISKPYPRKGTETIRRIRPRVRSYAFQNHIPARGRKPIYKCFCVNGCEFQNHIPARGRKLSDECGNGDFDCISKPYPRKGTETFVSEYVYAPSVISFQNHIPARGRKPLKGQWKQIRYQYFKTISPQGDGNSNFSDTLR